MTLRPTKGDENPGQARPGMPGPYRSKRFS